MNAVKAVAPNAAAAPVPCSAEPVRVTLTPLTGRQTEVGLLADRWEQAHEGMGQVVLIMGEAGLGKSRLVDTIKAQVLAEAGSEADARKQSIIDWRCSPAFQNTVLHPVVDYLDRLLEFREDEPSAARFDRLAQCLEDGGLGQPEVVALFAKLLFLPPDERFPAAGLTPMREREETFRAVREWLRACSRRRPVLFVVEDLHWMDASSLDFLGQFIAEGLHDRVLTVLTCRPEFRSPWPAAAHQTNLALNRLTRRQVAELMGRDAGGGVPDSLVAELYQRTRGIPLLVEEFTRMLRELAIFDGAHEDEIPATLQQLVLARLDRMSSNREVAQFAATLGREFHYEMLAAVVNVDEVTLQAELRKLTEAEILHVKGQSPRCDYVFKHALLEEALHSALDAARRPQLHRRVAEVMEAQFPLTAENHPELLAQHFTEAGLFEKAAAYWHRAGRRSQERFANVEAIGHLTKGLELLATLPESAARDAREMELLGRLGTAYIAARGYAAPEVGPVFERARELAGRAEPQPQLFVMLRGHFAYHVVRGDFALCAELADRAVEFARPFNEPGILMEALFLVAVTAMYRGDLITVRDCCTQALADLEDRARTVHWATMTGENSGVTHRCYFALALWHLGQPERALALNREARALARSLNHPFSLAYALHHTGWLFQHGRFGADAQAAGEEEMRVAAEQGFDFWHATGTLYSAAGLLLRGPSEEGLQRFQQGVEAYRATGAGLGLSYYLGILGEAFMQAGRLDDARRTLDESLAVVEKNDERFQEAELHRLYGELHQREGNGEAAAACFQHAIELAQRRQDRAWQLRATVSLARLWQRDGRSRDAFTALSATVETFTEGLETPDLAEAAALLRELGHERLRHDTAAGIKYVRDCIPPPMRGAVWIDWCYVPASTLGGDTMGYHWVDEEHLALYLIDVTGHGFDSALLSVSVTNVIRSGSLSGADLREPDQVLAALNQAFQGSQHGHRYYTIWYGVYHPGSRALRYASGGHPAAVAIPPDETPPLLFPATGTVMGISRTAEFPVQSAALPPGSRLFIFSDGVYEIRRDKCALWSLPACIDHLATRSRREEDLMDGLLAHVRELRGSQHLDDDFSIIEVRL